MCDVDPCVARGQSKKRNLNGQREGVLRTDYRDKATCTYVETWEKKQIKMTEVNCRKINHRGSVSYYN